MKKLLTSVALFATMFAASPALADDVDPRAYAFTLTAIYHTGCEKLPDQLIYGIVLEMKNIPDSVLMSAEQKIHDEMVRDGSAAAWCAPYQTDHLEKHQGVPMKPAEEYGLLIEPVQRFGTEYIEVRVVRRDPEREYPIGCPSEAEMFYSSGVPKHLLGLVLDGLGMYGFITDGKDPAFIAHDIEFRDVHSSGESKLKAMLKAIRKVKARVEKDNAREPGDKFMAFAASLKLTFAVERIKRTGNGDPDNWRWMSIAEGRNRYRDMIEQAVAAAVARRAA
jgi:hypothetical protein